MSKCINVKSKIRETYTVNFIDDLSDLLIILEDKNSIFIIDNKVYKIFSSFFTKLELKNRFVIIESGELSKTLDYCQIVIKKLISLNIRKDDKLIAIGGGITQDIVAFISSILFRGVKWIFIPTTLLAQCDSCIGSKSSINFENYKNLLGTFNPPTNIYIYSGFLNTLTESEIRSGIGEMLHYFLTDGINLAKQITDQLDSIIIDRNKLIYFIEKSLKIKKKIIEIDEFDESIRHIFNYGHTFGHALEAITNYKIPHGHAVTLGMDLANYISFKKGLINLNEFTEMHIILKKNIPVFGFTNLNINEYLNALMKDKKNKENAIGCILSVGLGKVEKFYIENDKWLVKTILEYSNITL